MKNSIFDDIVVVMVVTKTKIDQGYRPKNFTYIQGLTVTMSDSNLSPKCIPQLALCIRKSRNLYVRKAHLCFKKTFYYP